MAADKSPLAQFEIHRLIPLRVGGVDVSFTNSAAYMVLAVGGVALLLFLATRRISLAPGRAQAAAELTYQFVAHTLNEAAGNLGQRYFPFLFTLFLFIAACNLLGMVPYTFTVTSHIAVTLGLSLTVFFGVTAIGFRRHGLGYLRLFLPEGVPGWIMPLIVFVEVLSYLIRPFSLAVRLTANMVAGHTMLKIFAGFVVTLGLLGGWLPLLMVIALTALEIFIAFLQAYVFAILTCIYLNDALHPGGH